MTADARRSVPGRMSSSPTARLAEAMTRLGRSTVKEARRRRAAASAPWGIDPAAVVAAAVAGLPETATSLREVINAIGRGPAHRTSAGPHCPMRRCGRSRQQPATSISSSTSLPAGGRSADAAPWRRFEPRFRPPRPYLSSTTAPRRCCSRRRRSRRAGRSWSAGASWWRSAMGSGCQI